MSTTTLAEALKTRTGKSIADQFGLSRAAITRMRYSDRKIYIESGPFGSRLMETKVIASEVKG